MLSRGSVWSKWDLHVHTPESIFNNGFGSDWDTYVKNLFERAILNEVQAIGITDYFLLEGYKILRKNYLENPQKMNQLFSEEEIDKIQRILILPNLEFRLKRFVGGSPGDFEKLNRKLNYHVIFSNEVSVEDIEQNFLGRISFDFDASTGDIAQHLPVNKANLEMLGKRLKAEHKHFRDLGKSDLHIGMLNASVDENEIAKFLAIEPFRGKYLLGINADEDLSAVSWNSQGHNTRKTLIKQCHFAFSSNSKTAQFLVGDFHESQEAFKNEFGTIKPCLWGSDSHDYSTLFIPTDKRNTWIKSNLSFEGLKQVVYDPLSRVKIQNLPPQSKPRYQVIKAVRFLDRRAQPCFSEDWIPINQDLTSIVGGKSSGKSLLLQHIARAVNWQEADRCSKLANSSSYEFGKSDADFDFEVTWESGEKSNLSDKTSSKPITYIPQLYINHLAEKDGRKSLNQLINDILSQNSAFKAYLSRFEKNIREKNQSIADNVGAYYLYKEQEKNITKEINAIGLRESVAEEIERLKFEIEILREKSGFTDAEQETYIRLTSRLSILQRRKEFLTRTKELSEEISNSIARKTSIAFSSIQKSIFAEIQLPKQSKFVSHVLGDLENRIALAVQESALAALDRAKNIPHFVKRIENESSIISEALEPLTHKIKDQALLAELNKKLSEENKKLEEINAKEEKRNSARKSSLEITRAVMDSYEELLDEYLSIGKALQDKNFQPGNEISIQAQVCLDQDKFEEFSRSFDRRGSIKALLGDLINDNGEYRFDPALHARRILEVFSKLIESKDVPGYRKGVPEEDVVKKLFSDCFYLNFLVFYREDEITLMSPGKRGLVLLNLILHLSNATHPILIDQPEDNLDNRTIYDQLKDFIRQRKASRQIVMVTHNANLVVSTDSECVIVANQDGQQGTKENKEFRFEYVSGAIEESFISPSERGVLYQKGIRQHICEILEGGIDAFKERELKYGLKH